MRYAPGRSIAALLILAGFVATSIAQAQSTAPNEFEVQFQGLIDDDPYGILGGNLAYSGTAVYDANTLSKNTSANQSTYDLISFTVVIGGTSIELTSNAPDSGLSITDSATDNISFISDIQSDSVLLGSFPLGEIQVSLGSSGPGTAFSGIGPGDVSTAYDANLDDQHFQFNFEIDGISLSFVDADEIGSAGTSVTFIGSSNNQAPTANAGPDQSGRPGDTVILDGSGSTDDTTPSASLMYEWRMVIAPAGSAATLSDPFSPAPTFVIDVPGTYVAELVVVDGDGLPSTADDVLVGTDNLAPTANAGPDQVVDVGNTVSLDGSGSVDPENDAISYEWTITTRPAGSTAELAGADTATPSLTPDVAGEYVVSLTASDFIGPGAPDSVVVTATSSNDGSTAFMIAQLDAASDLIANLPADAFRRGGGRFSGENYRRTALLTLRLAASRLSRYERTGNRRLLRSAYFFVNALLRRADGCVRNGTPDRRGRGRDIIVDCDAQAEINAILQPVAAALRAALEQ